MYEGKHIHFSPVDNKPLCSCSTKVCRQRRLNGYAFCIRHILEDSTAPFHLCSYVPQQGQNKCTNVISFTHPQGLCNTHLQAAGFPAAKRERRHNRPVSISSKEKPEIKTESVLEGFLAEDHHVDKLTNDARVTVSQEFARTRIHSIPMQSPLTPSSTSSSGGDSGTDLKGGNESVVLNGNVKNGKQKSFESNKLKIALQRKKLVAKRVLPEKPKPVENVPEIRLPPILQNIRERLKEEAEDVAGTTTTKSKLEPRCSYQRVWVHNSAGTSKTNRMQRRKLLIDQRKNQLRRRYLQYAESAKSCDSSSHLTLDLLRAVRRYPSETALLLQGQRIPASDSSSPKAPVLTRRKCCFRRGKEDSGLCAEWALPCANFCSRHILYSVDQQLFQFCSATSCSAPVLAVSAGAPLCSEHATVSPQGGTEGSVLVPRPPRRKSRSTSRRLRNRRRAAAARQMNSSTVHCIEAADNGMELDVETVDSPEICSPGHPTPAQLMPSAVAAEEVVMLEDHELTEVLNRLPDEAFQEIFAAAESSTRAMFEPGREDAEELERALVGDVHSLDKFSTAVVTEDPGDLGDLSLIDEHTLALAHDLVMGAGISPDVPHWTANHVLEHIDCNMEVMSTKRRLAINHSPARGSSPPSLAYESETPGPL